ncbi:hypothetical protein [Erythrobacter sp. HI0028]|uniref:hypothetical protein n=1 Tax=Erythrobacter sp. HI0028 TaxID=1822227 RepID=UPI0012E8CFBA|nr:hypothetical protein [Erythrobacter sp. HI0028]
MVEGDSRILEFSSLDRRPAYEPSLCRLRWTKGAKPTLFSAAAAKSLRDLQRSPA